MKINENDESKDISTLRKEINELAENAYSLSLQSKEIYQMAKKMDKALDSGDLNETLKKFSKASNTALQITWTITSLTEDVSNKTDDVFEHIDNYLDSGTWF